MRAARFYGRRDIRIEEVPEPSIGPGDLLLKISAVGICGTDAHEFAVGPQMFPIDDPHPVSGHVGPMIPGHELAGVVVDKAPDVSGFEPGSLVVSGAGISCGTCHWCRRASTNLCERYSTLGLHQDGGLAEYAAVPASTCVDASGWGISADTAALAQPMSIAVHALRRGRLQRDESAVILGAGGIGVFLTYAAAAWGDQVFVADLDRGRLQVAESLGATRTVEVGGETSIDTILEDSGTVPSVIYEVSGSAAGFEQALRLAQRGTRIVLVGLQHGHKQVNPVDISLRELELVGTSAHVCSLDLPEALRLLASRDGGWTDVAPQALALSELVSDGLEPLAENRTTRIKTLVDPWVHTARATTA